MSFFSILQQVLQPAYQQAVTQAQAAPAPPAPVPTPPQPNYQWAPDYSSYIDSSQYPGAQWMAASAGGGSEGTGPTAAGWYPPGGYDSSGTEGGYYGPQLVDSGIRNYWNMKDAG